VDRTRVEKPSGPRHGGDAAGHWLSRNLAREARAEDFKTVAVGCWTVAVFPPCRRHYLPAVLARPTWGLGAGNFGFRLSFC